MTEQQTVTCRSVCERIVQWSGSESWEQTRRDARLALGQPDGDADELRADVRSLTQQLDAANKRADDAEAKLRDAEITIANQNAIIARSSAKDVTIEPGKMTQRAEEFENLASFWKSLAEDWKKRGEDAETRLSELESVTGKTIAQHGDILERRIDNMEFLSGWLLDRLVERGAS